MLGWVKKHQLLTFLLTLLFLVDCFTVLSIIQKLNQPVKVLIIGFEPYGGKETNVSWEAVKSWNSQFSTSWSKKTIFKTLELPVKNTVAVPILSKALQDFQPEVTLMFGEQDFSDETRLETLSTGPLGDQRESTLPLEKIREQLVLNNFKTTISDNPGKYVCNFTFYTALISPYSSNSLIGFIHIPRGLDQGQSSTLVNLILTTILTK